MRMILASFHLLALALGFGAIVVRALALRALPSENALRRVFQADNAWGLAAILWAATGVLRAFFGYEKGTSYYLAQGAFHLKLTFFALILFLEVAPMISLLRWRLARAKGKAPDLRHARLFSTFSWIQVALLVAMVFAAVALTR